MSNTQLDEQRTPPRSETFRIGGRIVDEIRRIAQRQDMAPKAVIKQWIAAGLQQQREQDGSNG